MRVYSWALLWKRSLFPCCVPGIEAARDLQVNKPETRGAAKHTHVLAHMSSYGVDAFQTRPLFSLPPTSPGTLALCALHVSPTHTHTHTHTLTHNHITPPPSHSTPLIRVFASSASLSHAQTKKQLSQVHSHSWCRLILLVWNSCKTCGISR